MLPQRRLLKNVVDRTDMGDSHKRIPSRYSAGSLNHPSNDAILKVFRGGW